jgi:hypothetical protein
MTLPVPAEGAGAAIIVEAGRGGNLLRQGQSGETMGTSVLRVLQAVAVGVAAVHAPRRRRTRIVRAFIACAKILRLRSDTG